MLENLYDYFGIVGIVSILVWSAVPGLAWAFLLRFHRLTGLVAGLGAVVLIGVWTGVEPALALAGFVGMAAGLGAGLWLARGGRLDRPAFAALVVSIAGVFVADLQNLSVAMVRMDQSKQEKQQKEKQRAERQKWIEKRQAQASDIRFPEDSPEDRLDVAGMEDEQKQKKQKEGEAGGAKSDKEPPGKPAWQRGREKKERDPDQSRDRDAQEAVGGGDEKSDWYTYVPGKQYSQIKRLNKWNLAFADRLLYLGLLIGLVDYGRRWRRLLPDVAPLPLACRSVTETIADPKVVRFGRDDHGLLPWYLRRVVQKGESFVYLGDHDPVGEASLPRWEAADGWRCVELPRFASPERGGPGHEFAFESVWFGCGWFAATDGEASAAARRALIRFLRFRWDAGAVPGRLMHVVWWPSEAPDRASLEELAFLCRETGCPLTVWGPEASGVAADVFDVVRDPAGPPPELGAPTRGLYWLLERGLLPGIQWGIVYGRRGLERYGPVVRDRLLQARDRVWPTAMCVAAYVAERARRLASAWPGKFRKRAAKPARASAPEPEAAAEAGAMPEPDAVPSEPAGAEADELAAALAEATDESDRGSEPEAAHVEPAPAPEASWGLDPRPQGERVRFRCPGCGKTLAAKQSKTGRRINCPACSGAVLVPEAPAAEASAVESDGSAVPDSEPEPEARLGLSPQRQGDRVAFRCPSCRKKLAARAHKAGERIDCPACSATVAVPDVSAEPTGDADTREEAPAAPVGLEAETRDGRVAFRCPGCRKKLAAKSAKAGSEITCPHCDGGVTIPTG